MHGFRVTAGLMLESDRFRVGPPIWRKTGSEAGDFRKWAVWASVVNTGEPICPESKACATKPLTPEAQGQLGAKRRQVRKVAGEVDFLLIETCTV